MNIILPELKQILAEISLLSDVAQSYDEQCALLDSRDAQPFDDEWVRVHKAIEQEKRGSSLNTAIEDEIRELAFKKAYQNTGNGEIAGYVSDDFDLLARAIAVGYSDPWLELLLDEYQSGRFPHGDLTA
jgi:hypothetical protein